MAVATGLATNFDIENMLAVVCQVVWTVRVELTFLTILFALWLAGGLAGLSPRNDGKKSERMEEKRALFSGAPLTSRPRVSQVRRCAGPASSYTEAELPSRTLAPEELRDPEIVAPRIIQMCRTQLLRALQLYRSAQKAGMDLKSVPEELAMALVTSSIRAGHTEEALDLLRGLHFEGPGVSPALLASATKLCTSKHLFKECLEIYDFMLNSKAWSSTDDRSIWSCLLLCSVETQAFSRCPFFFEKLKATGTGAPAQKDYWNMVRFASVQGDWKLLLQIKDEMRGHSIEVGSVIYNTVLATCVTSDNMEQARLTLDEMHAVGGVADVITYNTIMKGYAKAGDMDQCFSIFELMRDRGVTPSQVSYGILLDGCVNENQVERAAHVFDCMTQDGCVMNTVLYTTLIKGFARVGKVADAMRVYDQMIADRSVPPDLITYSILIKANCDACRLEEALKLLSTMLKKGLKPDEVVFNNLLVGCAKQANPDLAKRLYADMVSSGIRPSNATFSILIRLYCQCSLFDEAVDLLRCQASLHNVVLEMRLFSQLIQCCVRARQGRRAAEVYELMLQHSPPTASIHTGVLTLCVKLNMFDTASEILGLAAKNSVRVDANDANLVLEGALRKHKTHSAEACFTAMKSLGLAVNPQFLEQLKSKSKS